MKQNWLVLGLVLLLSPFIKSESRAEIVFQDSFESHSDWASPPQQLATQSDVSYTGGSATSACSVCPDGEPKYDGFFDQRAAWADFIGQPLAKIDATNARGGSGKALTFWHEPINSSSCDGGTYWCSGGVLSLSLPSSYNELFVRFYIKFQPGWVWDDDPTNGAIQKFLRISNFHRPPGNLFAFGPTATGSHHPVAYWDIAYFLNAGGGDQMYNSFSARYNATFYSSYATPADSSPSIDTVPGGTGPGGGKKWSEYLGDGNWHCIEMHVKGNTSGGYYPGTPNGEWDFWVDGQLLMSRKYMAWADGVDSDNYWAPTSFPGWNHVNLGGNAYNKYYSQTSHTEQWYAIDDLKISTTYVGPDSALSSPVNLRHQ